MGQKRESMMPLPISMGFTYTPGIAFSSRLRVCITVAVLDALPVPTHK
jgi:hypothetical protein